MTAMPIQPKERVEAMDVLRGFALLGVFVVNMLFFAAPYQTTLMRPWPEAAQPWFMAFLLLFWQGKFYCLFSFLFGMGFAEQVDRLLGRGEAPGPIYRRRLAWLLVIGLTHGLLVWMGDILSIYALLGFLLLLFRTRKQKTLLVWALCLIVVPALLFAGLFLVLKMVQGIPLVAAQMAEAAKQQDLRVGEAIARSFRIYGHGPYGELFLLRARELGMNYGMTLSAAPQILAMFLLGAWTSRRGVLKDPEAHRGLVSKVLGVGLTVGLLGNAFHVWCSSKGMPGPRNPLSMLGMAVYFFAAPALTLAYAAGILRLLQGGAAALLKPLAWNGRMALSNYLTHSLVFTWVFYFFGLGLFGKISAVQGFCMALGLWLLQIPLSRWWLSRHAMGPAETVWRRLTYGKG
ncbi:MAG TPA: hypothetical protein DHV93_09650 [Holophagaceae bacterium]|nr:hypothetical protein [Holophagaceae bacterium]